MAHKSKMPNEDSRYSGDSMKGGSYSGGGGMGGGGNTGASTGLKKSDEMRADVTKSQPIKTRTRRASPNFWQTP